ncbi:amidohydrolase family protein [Streptomyces ardesiacus]|uniref:amidohydrolase family protein n=1 Tax=Streptomyces ardesiacus TaxID=285564 RepID=UPI00201ECC07|nr:amidohydrolase family protein [Streptomyces ardesiacus]
MSEGFSEALPEEAESGPRAKTSPVSPRGFLAVAGTDAPIDHAAVSLHMNLRAMVTYGFTPYEALTTATGLAGETLHEDLGRIAPGMYADLAVVDGDPLTDIKDAANVEQVLVSRVAHTVDSLMRPFADPPAAAFRKPDGSIAVPPRYPNTRPTTRSGGTGTPTWRRHGTPAAAGEESREYIGPYPSPSGWLLGRRLPDGVVLPGHARCQVGVPRSFRYAGKEPLTCSPLRRESGHPSDDRAAPLDLPTRCPLAPTPAAAVGGQKPVRWPAWRAKRRACASGGPVDADVTGSGNPGKRPACES